ncbi:MAG: hypothetical protein L0Y42_13175, partial [Phycisphaerales bacterium]|nr:hypothetical protein [Phycisphaerales bacterium]
RRLSASSSITDCASGDLGSTAVIDLAGMVDSDSWRSGVVQDTVQRAAVFASSGGVSTRTDNQTMTTMTRLGRATTPGYGERLWSIGSLSQ